MADLTGKLSQVGNIVLDTEAATNFNAMVTAYNSPITIVSGYKSEWDIYKEFIDYLKSDFEGSFDIDEAKAMLEKAQPTEADRTSLASMFANANSGWFDFSPLLNNSAWANFKKYKASWVHPFLKEGEEVLGWPNKADLDPRRSGKLLVLQVEQASLNWLFQNSYKYGFIWYGPTDGTFLYVGKDVAFGENFTKAAAFGLKAASYVVYKAGPSPKADAVEADVTAYINGLADTTLRGNLQWTGWKAIMNEVN
jgi:hypothetical protein